MRRLWFAVALSALLGLPYAANAACPKCVAEEVTALNAASRLIGGSDAAGGIGDWYLTNGKVEAIVDDVGRIDIPVVGGTEQVNATSSNAIATGGTLVDVGLYKKNNDQLPQSFQVAGLSLSNAILFRPGDETTWGLLPGPNSNPCPSVDGLTGGSPSPAACASDPNCASITVFGIALTPNVSSVTAPTLFVRTRYEVCDKEQQVRLRTELWNQSGNTQTGLPLIDVFLWGGRGLDAFVPVAGRGFNHPELDLGNAAGILTSSVPFWFAPGNVNKADGRIHRSKVANEVSYGHLGGAPDPNSVIPLPIGQNDPDGPGPLPAVPVPFVNTRFQQGLHGNLLSAALLPTITSDLNNGTSRIFNRSLIIGKKNDGNSVTGDPTNTQNIFKQLGYVTAMQAGKVTPPSKEEGMITFTRTGGSALTPAVQNNSPITSIRTKGTFKVALPAGTYQARAIFPGRDDVVSAPFTVSTTSPNPSLTITSLSPLTGKVTATIKDATTNKNIPAKLSFSPSPVFHREFEAYNFDLFTGMCSNNLNDECVVDADCGGSNTCFRTCANVQPTRCTTNADCTSPEVCASDKRCRQNGCTADYTAPCGPDIKCKADAESIVSESFSGGAAQMNVVYTHNGKVNQVIKPGTYDVYVSRGPEYTVRRFQGVVVGANSTVDIGGGSPITLSRVVDTSDWTSADFHIHSARSLDSSAPLEARVRSFAAEGLEVMVSTDHDIVTDYIPAITKLNLKPYIGSIVGTEVTTSVGTPPYFSNAWGHINAWPQNFNPDNRRSGSAEDENVSVNIVYDRLRSALPGNLQCIGGKKSGGTCTTNADCKGGKCKDVGTPVIQMNHVRAGVSGVVNIGFFDNIGYDPAAPITDCQKYPVICPSSECFDGVGGHCSVTTSTLCDHTSDCPLVGGGPATEPCIFINGTNCTSNADCTDGMSPGVCGCVSASVPLAANGCNAVLLDLNVVPQASLCTTPGCGSGVEIPSGTRNIDADAMEVDNGGNASGWPGTKALRRDWLSLMNQGFEVGAAANRHPLWATGASDSHRLIVELPGYSRTYVQAGDLPNPSTNLDIKEFNQKVLDGNMFASTAPFVTVEADNGTLPAVGLGQTLDASGGTVNLDIEVQAAPWVPIDEVRVIKNGCVLACYNTSTTPAVSVNPADPYEQVNTNVVRFNATIADAAVTEDSYYVVEASPNLPLSGGAAVDPVVNNVAQGMFPYAVTNPIFADFDGGGYTGIGTPNPTCGALPPSCSAGAAVAEAPITPATMFAQADKNQTWLDRIFQIVLPSVQAHDGEPRPESEEERIQQHEETIRKQGEEYFPRQFFKIPTPKPGSPEDDSHEQPQE